MEKFLWEPSGKRKKESLIEDFSKYINIKSNYNFKTLWKWSVDHPEEFWSKFWDYSNIIGDKGKKIIDYNKIFNKTKFFPDSKLNYTENILKKKNSALMIFGLFFSPSPEKGRDNGRIVISSVASYVSYVAPTLTYVG
mgnify:CR=1 FL=1